MLAARRADRIEALARRIRDDGGQADPALLDVTDRDAVQAFADDLDRCDVLVNNAGGAFGAETVADSDPADWQAMYDVNVLGTLHVTQALLPKLIGSGAGTIVVMRLHRRAHLLRGRRRVRARPSTPSTPSPRRCGWSCYDQPVRVIEIAPGMVRTDEFALNRFRGDAAQAAAVYAGVGRAADRRRRRRHASPGRSPGRRT